MLGLDTFALERFLKSLLLALIYLLHLDTNIGKSFVKDFVYELYNKEYPNDWQGNKMKLSKIILTSLMGILLVALMISCYLLGSKRAKVIAIDLSVEEPTFDEREPRYKFMPKEFSHYICDLCEGLGDDPDVDVAILMHENPKFDPNAIHVNDNGTIDIDLWQQNDRYLWTTFVERYWKFDNVEFNPFNWKHSTYIAVHHIHYLKQKLKAEDDVIMAYNCGENAVMSGDIPASTLNVYLSEVKNNLYLLRSEK